MMSRFKARFNALLSNHLVSQGISRWGSRVLITSVAVTSMVVGLRQLGVLEAWELRAFDQLVRARPDEGKDRRLLVVGITDQDIAKLPSFPVSDEILARALEKLQQHQARVIGIDILRDIPIGEGRKKLVKALQEPNIVAVCAVSGGDQNPGTQPPPEIANEQVAFADVQADVDGVERRTFFLMQPPAAKYPKKHFCNDANNGLSSLAFKLAFIYFYVEGIDIDGPDPKTNKPLKIGSTIFKNLESNAGGYHNLEQGGYQILQNYRSATQPTEQVSLFDLLDNKVDPQLIRDRAVLIGYTAASVKDNFLTPYSANWRSTQYMPGVVVHAQVVSQILSAVLNKRPLIWYFSETEEWVWIGVWSLIGGILTWRKFRQEWLVIGLELSAIAALIGICYTGLVSSAAWVPLVPSGLTLVGTAVIVLWWDRFRKDPEIDWDIIREEENKKKEQSERTERQKFLTQLQQKAKELKQKPKNKHSLQDARSYQMAEDGSKLVKDFSSQGQEWGQWCNSLFAKADTIRNRWHTDTLKPYATEEVAIYNLLKKSKYLRSQKDRSDTLEEEELTKLLNKSQSLRNKF